MSEIWQQALSPESSGPPFAGDLENATYTGILQSLRDFKPENFVEEEKEQE